METADLPAPEFEALTAGLLEALEKGAGEHTRARFHADLEDAPVPTNIDSLRGGSLKSSDPAAQAKGPFVGGQHSKSSFALFEAAVAAGRPLFLIHYDFKREAGSWVYQLTLQSYAERERVLSERSALDDTLDALMIESAPSGWTRIALARSDTPPLVPTRLLAYDAKKVRSELPVSADLKANVNALWSFYRERGFTLESIAYELKGGARKKVRDFSVYYVGRPAVET